MDSATEEETAAVEDVVVGSSPAMVRRRKALGGKNPKYLHALRLKFNYTEAEVEFSP